MSLPRRILPLTAVCALLAMPAYAQQAATASTPAAPESAPTTLPASAPAAPRLPLPKLTAQQAKELLLVARQAMDAYLTARTAPDKLPIPDSLRDIAGRKTPAAVALRTGGKLAARVVVADQAGLVRNVQAAAQQAMRSPLLPDRVTPAVLKGLTVQLEILGDEWPCPQADLPSAIKPGITGVKVLRGAEGGYLTPGTQYELGLDVTGVRANAAAQVPSRPDNAGVPLGYWLYRTRHFVGLPDGKMLSLRRGRIAILPEELDAQSLASAREALAGYLIAHQDESGMYKIADSSSTLRDHLYATWVMARVAATNPKLAAKSVSAALAYAAKVVREDAARAYVVTEDPADQLAATAFLCMAIADSKDQHAIEVRNKLLAALAGAKLDGAFTDGKLEAPTGKPVDRTAQANRLADAGLLCLALAQADSGAADRARLALASARPKTAMELAWLVRGGAMSPKVARQLFAKVMPVRADDADEFGGYSDGGGVPSSALTALVVTAGLDSADQIADAPTTAPAGEAPASRLAGGILPGQAFLLSMQFKDGEAYMAEDPASWVGAIRENALGPRVTLGACAAALDAMLTEARN